MGWGGQENRSLRESAELIRRGHRAIIMCQRGSGLAREAATAGIPSLLVDMKSSADPRAILFAREAVRREKVDIINTHSSRDSWIASLGARFSGRRHAVVRTRHLAIGLRKSLTYTFLPNMIVAVSEYVRRLFLEKGIEPDKVVTIASGIDMARFDPSRCDGRMVRRELNIGPSEPVVVMVAILRHDKGHYYFVHAAAEVLKNIPAAKFLIVGDGPQKDNIRRYIRELGLGRSVLMTGLRKDIPDVLAASSLYVIPSLREGMGQSTMEAMAMGLPVIASNVGGLPELVKDGETGLLVPPADMTALAGAMKRLLEDQKRASVLAERGKDYVRNTYAIGRTVDRTLDLYLELLYGRRGLSVEGAAH
jgi:glycosyltransferase involved in cell wall biosynthesis